jgi:hypothetical protein
LETLLKTANIVNRFLVESNSIGDYGVLHHAVSNEVWERLPASISRQDAAPTEKQLTRN